MCSGSTVFVACAREPKNRYFQGAARQCPGSNDAGNAICEYTVSMRSSYGICVSWLSNGMADKSVYLSNIQSLMWYIVWLRGQLCRFGVSQDHTSSWLRIPLNFNSLDASFNRMCVNKDIFNNLCRPASFLNIYLYKFAFGHTFLTIKKADCIVIAIRQYQINV